MEPKSSRPSPPRRASPLAALVVAVVAASAAWWGVRTSRGHALDRALSPWAQAPLPTPGSPVDHALADLGAQVFDASCKACHAVRGEPRLGPNLEGVTRRREYPWLRDMIMAPDSMTRDDPVARSLFLGYGVQMMVAGGMDAARTRAVLEFLRRADAGEAAP